MEYRAIYKCRLCGERYKSVSAGKRTALQSSIKACLGYSSAPQAPLMADVHLCKDGSYGIADFEGFKKKVENNG